jgi:hypothetical protein
MAQQQKQPQGQAAPKDSADNAKRAKCFEDAQAAAATGRDISEKNARASSAYHDCAKNAGIRP